jgi:hypothetical protein
MLFSVTARLALTGMKEWKLSPWLASYARPGARQGLLCVGMRGRRERCAVAPRSDDAVGITVLPARAASRRA